MAVHSLVFMPVVIHSQNRKKCLSTGCRSTARCAECRCRYTVTATMVMWVRIRVMAVSVSADKPHRPWASQSRIAVTG
jgi:hypothetical protein